MHSQNQCAIFPGIELWMAEILASDTTILTSRSGMNGEEDFGTSRKTVQWRAMAQFPGRQGRGDREKQNGDACNRECPLYLADPPIETRPVIPIPVL